MIDITEMMARRAARKKLPAGVFSLKYSQMENMLGRGAEGTYIRPEIFMTALENKHAIYASIASLSVKPYKAYKAARKWVNDSGGMGPIFVSEEILPFADAESVIRHEMIHAAHLTSPRHPFFEEAINKTQSLSNVLTNAGAAANISDYQLLVMGQRSKPLARQIAQSERLAWTHENNPAFLEQVAAAGIPTHFTIAKDIAKTSRLAEQVMRTGEGAAISKAGTSWVPAILKRTARIIKNAL